MTSRLTRVGAFFVFAAASTHTVDEALQGLAAAHGNVHVVTRNSNLLDIQAFLACKGVLKPVGILRRPIPRGRALELRGWRRHDWQLQLLRSSWHLRSWHLRSWHLCSWHLRSRTWR